MACLPAISGFCIIEPSTPIAIRIRILSEMSDVFTVAITDFAHTYYTALNIVR